MSLDNLTRREFGLLVFGALACGLLVPKAYAQTEIKYEDVDLSKFAIPTGNPQYTTLEDALKHEPREIGTRTRINVYPGDYSPTVFTRYSLDKKQAIVGVNPPIRTNNMTGTIPSPKNQNVATFTNCIFLVYEDAQISRLHIGDASVPTTSVVVYGNNVTIKENYIEPTGVGIGITNGDQRMNTLIKDNVIFGNGASRGISLARGIPYSPDYYTEVIGNIFYNHDIAFLAQETTYAFLGDTSRRGNNIFTEDRLFMRLQKPPVTMPAQYNLFIDQGAILTTETAITDKILVTQPASQPTKNVSQADLAVQVVPFLTEIPRAVTAAKGWARYL